ncbi:hypothetical protein GCM10023231_07370 [Olivibacter ginsenosidimutans]|uniref:Nitroreductase domain-containing protein n=1 Tax=Olivibacter ginsenosidimutans TaxID=1176537 RepID=A0ABP9AKA1_9SPHI
MFEEEVILNAIKYRRSIFPASYTDQEIADETIMEILKSANYAPNHKLTQPWRFTVFKENGLVSLANEMARLYKEQTNPAQFVQKKYESIREKITQSAVVITIQIKYSGLIPQWEEVAAIGCSVQNLWLAAYAKGIGGYWSTPGTIRYLRSFLSLEEEEECLGLFYLGYHQEKTIEGFRKPIDERVKWVKKS